MHSFGVQRRKGSIKCFPAPCSHSTCYSWSSMLFHVPHSCCWTDLFSRSSLCFAQWRGARVFDCFSCLFFLKWAAGSLSCFEYTMNRSVYPCVCMRKRETNQKLQFSHVDIDLYACSGGYKLTYANDRIQLQGYSVSPPLCCWLTVFSLYVSPLHPPPPLCSRKQDTANFQLLFVSHFQVEVCMWEALCKSVCGGKKPPNPFTLPCLTQNGQTVYIMNINHTCSSKTLTPTHTLMRVTDTHLSYFQFFFLRECETLRFRLTEETSW